MVEVPIWQARPTSVSKLHVAYGVVWIFARMVGILLNSRFIEELFVSVFERGKLELCHPCDRSNVLSELNGGFAVGGICFLRANARSMSYKIRTGMGPLTTK